MRRTPPGSMVTPASGAPPRAMSSITVRNVPCVSSASDETQSLWRSRLFGLMTTSGFRKPLVVMSPKSLLRHKLCVSSLAELTQGTFRTVIDDIARGGAPEAGVTIEPGGVRRILLCSGKIYYELLAARRERALDWAVLVRVEQLYPFPAKELEAIFAAYPEARQVYWVQEEPWNMGAWHVMYRRLRRVLPDDRTLGYAGRPEAASPATGSYKLHQVEERDLVNYAFAR